MDFIAEERQSDSPFVERVWRSHGEQEPFISVSAVHYNLVVSRYQDKMSLTVRGPEIRATPAFSPAGVDFFGLQFRPGTFMPYLPPKRVIDRRDVNLPEAASQSFWLCGSAWEFPDYENADTFVDRLVQEEILVHDPVVTAVLQGETLDLSLRTVQRRFLQATGLTHGAFSQIQRARHATTLLKQGVPILDVVDNVGYADQPHLTRSLKRLMGYTPVQIVSENCRQPLSFLFKTETI